jgi:hypothetical protein
MAQSRAGLILLLLVFLSHFLLLIHPVPADRSQRQRNLKYPFTKQMTKTVRIFQALHFDAALKNMELVVLGQNFPGKLNGAPMSVRPVGEVTSSARPFRSNLPNKLLNLRIDASVNRGFHSLQLQRRDTHVGCRAPVRRTSRSARLMKSSASSFGHYKATLWGEISP